MSGLVTQTPLWLEDRPDFPQDALPDSVECLVVGAGLAGSWLALELARQGREVLLLEEAHPAAGASGRNAGQLVAALSWPYARAVDILGRERAREARELVEASMKRLGEELADCRSRVQYMQTGSLACAAGDRERRQLEQSARLLQEDGFEAEFWTADQLTKRYGASPFHGALHQPGDATLHPAALVWTTLQKFRDTGGSYAGEGVSQIREEGGWVHLRTDSGELRARQLFCCAGARVPRLFPLLEGRVRSVQGQIMMTEPERKVFVLPMYSREGAEYWRQGEKGHVLIGGCRDQAPGQGLEREAPEPDPAVHAALEEFRRRSFPKLAAARTAGSWTGQMAFTPDGLPLAGRLPGHTLSWVLAGFNGCGLCQIPEWAHRVARALQDDSSLPAWADPARFA